MNTEPHPGLSDTSPAGNRAHSSQQPHSGPSFWGTGHVNHSKKPKEHHNSELQSPEAKLRGDRPFLGPPCSLLASAVSLLAPPWAGRRRHGGEVQRAG